MERSRPLRVVLAQPRGFCAGVVRAVQIVERALEIYGPPVYVRHQIVHNRHVVESLEARGARFVESVADIPEGAVTVFSAHGVSRKVETDAEQRGLDVIDATCPLVKRVHNEARRNWLNGLDVVLVGHEGHPEIEGILGQIPGKVHLISDIGQVAELEPADPDRIAYSLQTTLSLDDTREIVDALKARFPGIVGAGQNDICYATQNRQNAIRELAQHVQAILVIGADYSSNSRRLCEIGQNSGVPSYLIPEASAVDPDWLADCEAVGVTAGASAPEHLIQGLIKDLSNLYDVTVEQLDGVNETATFNLPPALRTDQEPARDD